MRFIQFLKWWWDQNDYFYRTVGCFIVFWAIPCGISVAFVGKAAVLAILFGILAVVVGWVLALLGIWLHSLWLKFDSKHPAEDVEIIRRLKGEFPVEAE